MTEATAPVPPYVWSTEGLASGDRLPIWRKRFESLLQPMRVEAGRPRNFHGSLRIDALGPIIFVEVASRRQVIHRSRAEIARGSGGYFFVSVMSRGTGWLHNTGRMVRRGEVSFVDGDQPYSLEFRRDFTFISAVIPKTDLLALAPQAAAVHGAIVPAPAGPALGALLISLAQLARQDADDGRTSDHGPIYGHFLALAATGVRAAVERMRPTELTDDERLMSDIKAWLVQALPNETVNTAAVASAFALSRRKVQRLFQADGGTLAHWLRRERLSRCARDLASPRKAGLTLTEIALGWGFSDMAYFCRSFRAAYGAAPSAWRSRSLVDVGRPTGGDSTPPS